MNEYASDKPNSINNSRSSISKKDSIALLNVHYILNQFSNIAKYDFTSFFFFFFGNTNNWYGASNKSIRNADLFYFLSVIISLIIIHIITNLLITEVHHECFFVITSNFIFDYKSIDRWMHKRWLGMISKCYTYYNKNPKI